MIRRTVFYFEEPGPLNTEAVIEAVKERLKEGGARRVVVASDSGETALRFCEALGGEAEVIAISWKEMDKDKLRALKARGVVAVEGAHTPLSVKERAGLRDAYYTLGQGFKVAVEVTLIAADKGLVEVGEEIIAVGGTGKGADTAVVVKASSTREMLRGVPERRLEVKEIIAMPLKKKWWE